MKTRTLVTAVCLRAIIPAFQTPVCQLVVGRAKLPARPDQGKKHSTAEVGKHKRKKKAYMACRWIVMWPFISGL